MRIAVFGRTFSDYCTSFIQSFIDECQKKNVELVIFEEFRKVLRDKQILLNSEITFNKTTELEGCKVVVCFGGDGTLLETVTYVRELQLPILAINAGRLGFLANIPIERAPESVNYLIDGAYKLNDRILVQCNTQGELFGITNFGLNEFVIQKRDTSSMIVVHTYVDGDFLNAYWVDGIIVSTPTGSTGYSLSCGGPLVMPQTNNFVIAPVNPHNLNVRPIIVPDTSVISFKVEGRADNCLLSLDSRSVTAKMNIELEVCKSVFKAHLINLPFTNFFNTLRSKLNWGMDIRN